MTRRLVGKRKETNKPYLRASLSPPACGRRQMELVAFAGFGLGSGSVTLSAFDYLGNLLGSVTETDDKPEGSGPILTLNLTGIHSVTFSSTSGTVGFDNFQFGDLTAAPVPGPIVGAGG